jgi:hypothetical protein
LNHPGVLSEHPHLNPSAGILVFNWEFTVDCAFQLHCLGLCRPTSRFAKFSGEIFFGNEYFEEKFLSTCFHGDHPMGIFRCTNCDYERRGLDESVGKKARCPRCQTLAPIVADDVSDDEPESEYFAPATLTGAPAIDPP